MTLLRGLTALLAAVNTVVSTSYRENINYSHDNGHAKGCVAYKPAYNVTSVLARALQLSSHSWEFGTASEALLEYYNPSIAVFSSDAFPIPNIRQPDMVKSLAYSRQWIRVDNTTLIDGDGAAGDPASLGVSAVLLGQSNSSYMAAAQREADHLLYDVPRMSNGAISHRDTSEQAWADFVYMGPPFLAYYAAATNNITLLTETVRQCGLYRQLLQVNHLSWSHILVESGTNGNGGADPGLWSTGDAWAAAGMTRVLATVEYWTGAESERASLRAQLVQWIGELIDGARSRELDNGLLRNYLNDTTWFGETSGTALMTAATYRMAVLAPEHFDNAKYLSWADARRAAVAAHVTMNGTLSPSVNPLGWGDRTEYTAGSPEGQSFGVLLESAYRDYICSKAKHGL